MKNQSLLSFDTMQIYEENQKINQKSTLLYDSC